MKYPGKDSGATVSMVVLLLIVIAVSGGCRPDRQVAPERQQYSFFELNGYQIPQLPSAELQLAYGHASFSEIDEQRAALRAVSLLFPQARREKGLAALDLAYLELGSDYRQATIEQRRAAIAGYRAILDDYRDAAEIEAKALWYLGWLHTDLLAEPDTGIDYYLRLLDRYPEQRLTRQSPAPWLSIRLTSGDEQNQPSYPQAVVRWADIGRIEIIRHSGNRELSRRCLRQLLDSELEHRLQVLGLQLYVEQFGIDQEVETMLEEVLAEEQLPDFLRYDLHRLRPRQPAR